MNKWQKYMHILLSLILLSGLSGWSATPLQILTPRLQPILLQMAVTRPEQRVHVIVQKTGHDHAIEDLVASLGGYISKDLPIINAFAAAMTADAARQLATRSGVRWVSLDAPTTSSSLNTTTTTLVLSPAQDTYITAVGAAGSTTNYGTCNSLGLANTLGSPAIYRRPLLKFDLSAIPTGATIVSAGLNLYASYVDHGGTVNAHRVTSDWDEGTAACTSNGIANWINRKAGPSAWTIPGGDYDPAVAAAVAVSAVGAYQFDLTALAQNWVNGTYGNYGILLEQPTQAGYGEISWQSKETFAPAQAPKLQVVFTTDGSAPTLAPVFVTWATVPGTVAPMGFTTSAAMYDSALGTNGTYGYGSNVKGAFGGFVAEVTPGNAIAKVEVVLRGYVSAKLATDLKLTPYFGGQASSLFVLDRHLFDSYVGAASAGMVYLDITTGHTWRWSDFDNDMQLVIDQSNAKQTVYYDAIGLRVTSRLGADPTSDTGGDTTALATVNTSQQLNVYNQIIRSTDLWNAANKLQGKGVTVAVVDSGLVKTNDLNKRIRANANFNAAYHDSTDRFGHGTFVAGIIAGNGSQSGNKYIGVAPRADLLNVRVSDDQGKAIESDVINALQWVVDNKARYNIRVVNLSLNSAVAQSYHTSPLDAAAEILWFNGIVVVVSAGNNGTATLFPPANDPFVITVGATDDGGTLGTGDDTVTTFSASGTTESGFAKPELVAPGRGIIGLLPDNDHLNMSATHSANRIDKTYFKMSGTSVSAPMVSGAVALLLQDEPNLTPDQVKYRLMATANKSWPGYNAGTAGAGYLDIYAAVYGTTTQSANTGFPASQLLWSGSSPINWNSVNWNSVNWNSVNWNSVNWNSVNWNSVNWNSDYWENGVTAASIDAPPPMATGDAATMVGDNLVAGTTDTQQNQLFLPMVSR